MKKFKEYIQYNPDKHQWGTPEGTDQMKSLTPGQHNPKQDSIKPVDVPVKESKDMNEEGPAAETKAEYRAANAEYQELFLGPDDIEALEQEIEYITDSDIIDILDYGADLEFEDNLGESVQLDEILSVQGRLKRRFAARKNKQKLKVARNIALRRGSTPDRLKKRAVRGARGMVYKRLLRGRDKRTLPPAEKARFEKMIQRFAPLVQRFAVKLLPRMRKMEINRMKSRKGGTPKKSKKYKVARPISTGSQKAKKFKIKK